MSKRKRGGVAEAETTYHEVLWLRGALNRIADAVGASALLLGAESRFRTLDDILKRLAANDLLRENLQWREYAWLSCPHDMNGKYGDDGEMQCQGGADFRRGKIEDLSQHIREAHGSYR